MLCRTAEQFQLYASMDFPGGTSCNNSPANSGDGRDAGWTPLG